ncbi:MAG: hypothetical protein ACKER6_01020 [Candidatus Hodgkinia cicadicola]
MRATALVDVLAHDGRCGQDLATKIAFVTADLGGLRMLWSLVRPNFTNGQNFSFPLRHSNSTTTIPQWAAQACVTKVYKLPTLCHAV